MRFQELIRVCYSSDYSIKNIFIEAETVEAKRLISSGPDSVLLSGIGVPIHRALDDESLADMEVLGVKIRDDSTLTIVI